MFGIDIDGKIRQFRFHRLEEGFTPLFKSELDHGRLFATSLSWYNQSRNDIANQKQQFMRAPLAH